MKKIKEGLKKIYNSIGDWIKRNLPILSKIAEIISDKNKTDFYLEVAKSLIDFLDFVQHIEILAVEATLESFLRGITGTDDLLDAVTLMMNGDQLSVAIIQLKNYLC